MSWYNEIGQDNPVVVSTRCRYARNLSGYKFPSKMSENDAENLIGEISDCFITSNASFSKDFKVLNTKDLKSDELLSLFEKRLVSHEFVKQSLPGACILSKDENVSIMLCEEDHIRLQVILPGYRIKEALDKAKKFDTLLEGRLSYAKSDRLGYLTACPTNLGSGLRISTMLHLPALTLTKKINGILNSLGKLGLTIRGMYGEGTNAGGNLYQLSNQITLGISDEDISKKVTNVVDQICQIELNMRNVILKENESELKNRCMRAYGILTNSYALTSEETLKYLSDVRLGSSLGILTTPFQNISNLLVLGSPSCIIAEKNVTEPSKRDILRAEMAKKLL